MALTGEEGKTIINRTFYIGTKRTKLNKNGEPVTHTSRHQRQLVVICRKVHETLRCASNFIGRKRIINGKSFFFLHTSEDRNFWFLITKNANATSQIARRRSSINGDATLKLPVQNSHNRACLKYFCPFIITVCLVFLFNVTDGSV